MSIITIISLSSFIFAITYKHLSNTPATFLLAVKALLSAIVQEKDPDDYSYNLIP